MIRNQTFHEQLIPLLVSGLGCESYLEFGTHENETISKVLCPRRYGVDLNPHEIPNVSYFKMSTQEFIRHQAEKYAPYSFVFVDADHSKEAVRADFFGIWRFVADEGIVVLHDTNPETVADTAPGLCGNAWEFARMLQAEAVTLNYHPGLTIVRKREHWGPVDAPPVGE